MLHFSVSTAMGKKGRQSRRCPRGSINYQVIQRKKEEWLKSLKLEEDKILDDEET